jgi:hypothetical protein
MPSAFYGFCCPIFINGVIILYKKTKAIKIPIINQTILNVFCFFSIHPIPSFKVIKFLAMEKRVPEDHEGESGIVIETIQIINKGGL